MSIKIAILSDFEAKKRLMRLIAIDLNAILNIYINTSIASIDQFNKKVYKKYKKRINIYKNSYDRLICDQKRYLTYI